MRAVGDGHQVGAIVVLVGAAGERLIVRQGYVVVLEIERLQHLGHGDVVFGVERDEQPATTIDEAVERRRLLGQERLLGPITITTVTSLGTSCMRPSAAPR